MNQWSTDAEINGLTNFGAVNHRIMQVVTIL